MIHSSRFARVIALGTALFACSGGGGGSTGPDLHLSASSVSFLAFSNEPASETKTLQITWSSSRVAGIAIGTPVGQGLPAWLQVDLAGTASPLTLRVTRISSALAPGSYAATIRVASGDRNAKLIEFVDLPVSFEVVPVPTISPTSLNLSWAESEQPASRQFTLTRSNRVQIFAPILDVNWLTAAVSNDTVTVSGNAQSAALPFGPYIANLLVPVALENHSTTINVPITASVGHALNGPAQIASQVNASTTLTDLDFHATITAATQAAIPFNASSNVTWLAVSSSGITGSANNLAYSLQPTELSSLPNGIHTGTITVNTARPNITPLQIPVSLNMRLPEVHFVAPVAFSDTVASDFVIVRGQGFDDPNAVVELAGNAVSSRTLVNDTEIRFVPGARTAGSYLVEVTNRLGFTRDKANLRVIDPPTYGNSSLAAAVGLQERIISSPANAMVFSHMCYFCTVTQTGKPSTVQRFMFDSGTGQWTRTQHEYLQLFDIALSLDESKLLVLTGPQLLLVDPQTMTTSKAVALPQMPSGTARQLAVLNNGLVIIHSLNMAYSLRTDGFVPVSGLSIADSGIQASRDGSRGIFGAPTNDHTVAYRYYDASTDSVVVSITKEHYSRGAYSRHAERAFVNNLVVDADLAFLGTLDMTSHTGDISPDGNRVYGVDFSTNPYRLRVFDLSSTFTELTPIPITGLSTGVARSAIDPRGNAVFVVSESGFFVFDVH